MSDPRYFHISTTGNLTFHYSLMEALLASMQGGYLWADLVQPSEKDLGALKDPFGATERFQKICASDTHLPLVEEAPRACLFVLHAFRAVDPSEKAEISLLLGEKFLITIAGKAAERWSPLADLEGLIKANPTQVAGGPAGLMQLILKHTLETTSDAVLALENKLDLSDAASPGNLRVQLFLFQRSLEYTTKQIDDLCRSRNRFIPDSALDSIHEIRDELALLTEKVVGLRNELAAEIENRQIALAEAASSAIHQNQTYLLRLLLAATIYLPLIIVVGLNVYFTLTSWYGSQSWIPGLAVLVGTALIGSLLFGVLARSGKS